MAGGAQMKRVIASTVISFVVPYAIVSFCVWNIFWPPNAEPDGRFYYSLLVIWVWAMTYMFPWWME